MATSTNLGLVLNNASEDTLVIDTWIDANTGTAETSNLQKIDAAYGNLSSQISQLANLSTMSFKVTDVDTSTQYAFGLQIKDGKTQLMYEEVV